MENETSSLNVQETEALGTVTDEKPSSEITTLNGMPHLSAGSIFAGRFLIEERIGWDDVIGASYFALPLNDRKELILRVDKCDREKSSGLFVEAAILKLAESKNQHRFFTQFHSFDLTAKFPWLAMYYRGAPSLKDCLAFLKGKPFTHGTAGRFAHDILSILEFIHQNAFLMTKLDMEILSLCPCDRHVFLSDMSYVKINPNKRQLRTKPSVHWRGFADYAPLSHHGQTELTQWDELEAFFYIFYEMVTGGLPWNGKRLSEIENLKLFFAEEDNFKNLPNQYFDLWNLVLESKKTEANDYSKLKDVCQEIYQTVGGITDLDQNYDFEVDFPDLPEEELPRFVLEKTPIEGSTNEEAGNEGENEISGEEAQSAEA